jgi:hypothetical protein
MAYVMDDFNKGDDIQDVVDGRDNEDRYPSRNDEERLRNDHRRPLRIWIGVGAGVLFLMILMGVLIATVILQRGSSNANAETIQGSNTDEVRWCNKVAIQKFPELETHDS